MVKDSNTLRYGRNRDMEGWHSRSEGLGSRLEIYRVIHEECHSFRELICHVMLMKKVHMNKGPILNSFGENDVFIQKCNENN